MKLFRASRRRLAVSEIIGSLLTIAITIIAGTAVWGYVRTQAGVSELSYANNVGTTNNFLNEQFKIVDMNFPATSTCPGATTTGCVQFFIYNTGGVSFSPVSVRLYDSAGLINIQYTVSGSNNYVSDLLSTQSSKCQIAASSYESTTLSTFTLKQTNVQLLTLTVPVSQGGCTSDPSYGRTLSGGTTYAAVVTGLYGNVVTYYQTK